MKKTQNIMFQDGKILYHKDDTSFQIYKCDVIPITISYTFLELGKLIKMYVKDWPIKM